MELSKVKKIYYMSDLHIDSYPTQDPLALPYHPEDGLILLGDYSNNFNKTTQYISSLSNRFKWIVFILGNHDFYNTHAGLAATDFMHQLYPYPDNIHFLTSGVTYTVGDWVMLGDTIWTDYFNNCGLQKLNAEHCLADFKCIAKCNAEPYVTTDDFLILHRKQIKAIRESLESLHDKKVILCTHHALSKQSIATKYMSSSINGAFVSDCEYLFRDNPNIKYALHGHCHDVIKYRINKTSIRCNPLGYKGERGITLEEYYQTIDFIKL